MSQHSERMAKLLETAEHLKEVIADESARKFGGKKRPVSVMPRGNHGDKPYLFSSVTAAAHFLIHCTDTEWTRTQRTEPNNQYKIMANVMRFVRELCGAEWAPGYGRGWKYLDNDSDINHCLYVWNAVDMRHYNP